MNKTTTAITIVFFCFYDTTFVFSMPVFISPFEQTLHNIIALLRLFHRVCPKRERPNSPIPDTHRWRQSATHFFRLRRRLLLNNIPAAVRDVPLLNRPRTTSAETTRNAGGLGATLPKDEPQGKAEESAQMRAR